MSAMTRDHGGDGDLKARLASVRAWSMPISMVNAR
jgi:hypothetical protein